MYDEEELLPLSGLSHVVFCERRAALIHVERIWRDNVSTVEGVRAHKRAHDGRTSTAEGVIVCRTLPLRSLELGVSGVADVVEFHRIAEADAAEARPPAGPAAGAALRGVEGLWRPFPVEYKRGRRREEESYEVQVCAQAMCLEEMLGTAVPCGALYFGQTRRRAEVVFDEDLRARVREAAARLHRLFASGQTPPAAYEDKCDHCSMMELCMPKAAPRGRAARYAAEMFRSEDDET